MGRTVTTSITSFGVVSALTVAGVAASQKAMAPAPTHAIRGVVKSISMFYVVIVTGSGKKARELTFMLGPSTERDGEITIGATVSVRYRKEGRTLLSTAVSAQPEKQHVAHIPRR
jgi:hypothetical protein